jgi:DNA modification methylase
MEIPARVYCGNALEPTAYATLMEGHHADMVFTDPPYNVPIRGNVSGLGSVRHREFKMGSGEMSETEYTNFLIGVCSLFALHTAKGSLHYIFMDWRHPGRTAFCGRNGLLRPP